MCGIIGCVQRDGGDLVRRLLDGLKRLEYRGYDSAGVAVLEGQNAQVRRRVGKLAALEEHLLRDALPKGARVGLGHTRWATHGRPSDANAHPHRDATGRLVLVHNGIIENYEEIKAQLSAAGHAFSSETDSEVLAHLVGSHLERLQREGVRGGIHPLTAAVRSATAEVRGAWAIALIHADYPDRIVATRKDSPLVIGVNGTCSYVASDIPAFLSQTRDVLYLQDGELAELTPDGVLVYDLEMRQVKRPLQRIEWDAQAAEKNGHPHYMLKEILEQPMVIARAAFSRLKETEGDVRFEDFPWGDDVFRDIQRIQIVACGTSLHAGLVGKFLLERWARIPVECDFASEYRYRGAVDGGKTLVIAITQSGETIDTIGALRVAAERGARTLTICNVKGSTLAREAEATILTHAGPEIGVASTKAFTSQLTALYLLALRMGRARGRLDAEAGRRILQDLRELVAKLEALLNPTFLKEVRRVAEKLCRFSKFFFLGRGLHYPIALEGALKLKEISYLHAEGYPAGEMKHGPIALVDPTLCTLVVAPQGRLYDKVRANVEEIMARRGSVVMVGNDPSDRGQAEEFIQIPTTSEELSPIVAVIPLQLLSYYIADTLGREIDQPRNLAKSVTVE
ncbi:MAG: glutamine--fructose-6-phosphate transaminase (isomerizing) [Planctomycetes bacterium]|nr:glutamine--fructose-6-phosphate transaminase (isomerizing) [Planctomycetota bacterium]